MTSSEFARRLLVFVLLAAVVGSGGWFYRWLRTSAPPRHIVLISIDMCRSDHFGCYGQPRPLTTHIDKVAAESVLFDNALSPVPITLPSHSSMLTGTLPPVHGVRNNSQFQLGKSNVTLAEILAEHGYVTGAISCSRPGSV